MAEELTLDELIAAGSSQARSPSPPDEPVAATPTMDELIALGPSEQETAQATPSMGVTAGGTNTPLLSEGVTAGGTSGPLPGPRQDMPVATGASRFWPYGHPAAEPTAAALTDPTGLAGPRTTIPLAATGAGFALGGPPGAALGGYLGTIGAETIGQYLESKQPGGKPFDPAGAGLSDIQWEALKGVVFDKIPFSKKALDELGSRGWRVAQHPEVIMAAARKILAPKRAAFEALQAADKSLAAAKGKLTLTPGEILKDPFLLRLQDYTNRYRTKAGDFFFKNRTKEMVDMTEDTLEKLDPNFKLAKDQFGKMIRGGTKISEQDARAISSKFFEVPRALIPDLRHRYRTPEIATEVSQVIDELAEKQRGIDVKSGLTFSGAARMPNQLLGTVEELQIGGDAAKLIQKLNLDNPKELGEMTYDRLRAIQTEIGELKGRVSDNDWRLLSRIANASEKSLDNQIAPTSPGLMAAITKARENYKLTVVKNFIDSGEYKMMQDVDASLLVDKLFPPGMSKESAQRIMAIMPPEMKKTMGAGWLYNLTNLKPGTVAKEFDENVFLENLNKFSPEVHELLLGKKGYQEIKELAEVMNIPRAATAGSRAESLATAGSTATQLGNIVAAGTGIGGVATGAAAGGIRTGLKAMGPGLVARLLYTPGGRRYLTEGLIPRNKALRGLGGAVIFGAGEIPAVAARMAFGDKWPLSDVREGLDIMARDIENEAAPYARGAQLAVPSPLQRAFGKGMEPPPRPEFKKAWGSGSSMARQIR